MQDQTTSSPDQKKLGFELLTLSEIFNGFSFRVPDYQRGYSWEKLHVEALLRDIEQLSKNEDSGQHYTGTLVLTISRDEDSACYDVVDGQQRLTTLVILLHALARRFLVSDVVEHDRLRQQYLWRGDVGNVRLALQLSQDSHRFFEQLLTGGGVQDGVPIELEAHDHLRTAWETVEGWLDVQLKQGQGELTSITFTIEKRLGFLVYAPRNDAEIGIMFEVINNRGKPLSELEKVKNYLIYCCSKLGAKATRERINQDWVNILHNLNRSGKTGVADEESFLRYCAVVELGLSKKDSQSVYDEFRQSVVVNVALESGLSRQDAIGRIESFVRFLELASVWYARLYHPDHGQVDKSLIPVLDQLRAQGQHASIMPLFLATVTRLSEDIPTLLRLLELIERLNFRVYMTKGATRRNDSGQGELYKYASKFYRNDFPDDWWQIDEGYRVESLGKALEQRLVAFVLKYSTDDRLEESLTLDKDEPFDFFNWAGLRYFLMNYEAVLQPTKTIQIDRILLGRQSGKSNSYFSVEHIWATNFKAVENGRPQDLYERRRIGNFVLLELGVNVQGSNHDLEQKIVAYRGDGASGDASDLKHVRLMCKDAGMVIKELIDEEWKLTKNYYTERQKRLNERQEKRYQTFALKRWSIAGFEGYKKLLKLKQAVDEPDE